VAALRGRQALEAQLDAERAAAAAAAAAAPARQPGRGVTPAELDRLLREQRHDAERRRGALAAPPRRRAERAHDVDGARQCV